jgi:hypothetical protein
MDQTYFCLEGHCAVSFPACAGRRAKRKNLKSHDSRATRFLTRQTTPDPFGEGKNVGIWNDTTVEFEKEQTMFLRNSIGRLMLTLLLAACGEGVVNITDSSFQPKIVIQGILVPEQPARVKLFRNFAVNTVVVSENEIILRNASASITHEASGNSFNLQFNTQSNAYESNALIVEYGQTYTLNVEATIDGQLLSATSTTTVPQAGFEINEARSQLGSMLYRQRDQNGELINFKVVFDRSPQTTYYAASYTALDADTSTFIYENPFGDITVEDVVDDFNDFKYTFDWIQDTPAATGESSIEVFSFFTWFYGDYRAVLYAADRNYRDFLTTFNQVREIDGNFHEPAFHIDGDGIGVFGSAVVDTAFFTILRPN